MEKDLSLNYVERLREKKVWIGIIEVMSRIEGVLVLFTLLLVFFSVILRYFFQISLLWSEEILTIAALWMYFIGAVIGTEEESHIKGDVISGLFKRPKARKLHKVIVSLFSVAVICITTIWILQYCAWQTELKTLTPYLRWPKTGSIYALGVGAVGMTFFFIYHCIRYITMKADKFAVIPQDVETHQIANNNQNGGDNK